MNIKKIVPKECPLGDFEVPENWKKGDKCVEDIESINCRCFIPGICLHEKNWPQCSMLRSDCNYLDCPVFGEWWWKGKYKQKFKEKNNQKRDPINKSLRHEVFKRDDFKCKECGASNKERKLHIDHILPVSQGGTDELSNLQTLCEDCNSAKSNKHFNGGK